MKNSLFVLFFLSNLSVANAQSEYLNCNNSSTGTAIFVYFDHSTRQTYYEMNPHLTEFMRSQGASLINRGTGHANWDQQHFLFRNFSGEFKVFADSGGIKVKFERSRTGSVNIHERAEFYFNPGECTFFR